MVNINDGDGKWSYSTQQGYVLYYSYCANLLMGEGIAYMINAVVAQLRVNF